MFNTIDLDRNRINERSAIIADVLSCSSVQKTYMERSPSGRGWHIVIICNREGCLRCRRKYDDPIRFKLDMKRKPYQRNVLFDRKTQYYPEAGIVRFFEKGKPKRVECS